MFDPFCIRNGKVRSEEEELALRNRFFRVIANALEIYGSPCRIRKCGRDGACTGPLVASDRVSHLIVPPPGSSEIALADGPFPLCFTKLSVSILSVLLPKHWELYVYIGCLNSDEIPHDFERARAARQWPVLPTPDDTEFYPLETHCPD